MKLAQHLVKTAEDLKTGVLTFTLRLLMPDDTYADLGQLAIHVQDWEYRQEHTDQGKQLKLEHASHGDEFSGTPFILFDAAEQKLTFGDGDKTSQEMPMCGDSLRLAIQTFIDFEDRFMVQGL